MSLILEALKKSEQQRRLGEMPTLGTPAPMSRRRRSLLPALVGLVVVALGAGWWLTRAPRTPSPTEEAKPAVTAPAVDPTAATPPASPPRAARTEPKPAPPRTGATTPATAPVVVPMPTTDRPGAVKLPPNASLVGTPATSVKPATPPAPTATAAPAEKPATPKPTVDAKPAAPAKPAVDEKATAPQASAAARDAKAQADTKAPASAPETKAAPNAKVEARPAPPKPAAPVLPSVWELPYGTRKELPDLKLTMHVYSSTPAERFVVIEGARHVEGDDLGDGVVLREISVDGMVLDFKGQRFLYPRDGR